MEETQKVSGKAAGARPNREGKPWKRADGRWCARVWPPAPAVRPKPRYVYGKTRKEAIEKRDALTAKLAQGLPKDSNQTVGDYMRRWLDVTLGQYTDAGELAQSTADSYRDNAELHIIPADGPTLRHVKLADLSVPVVRDWQHQLMQKPSGRPRRKLRKGETALPPPPPLSLRTVAYCRSILHKALEEPLFTVRTTVSPDVSRRANLGCIVSTASRQCQSSAVCW